MTLLGGRVSTTTMVSITVYQQLDNKTEKATPNQKKSDNKNKKYLNIHTNKNKIRLNW